MFVDARVCVHAHACVLVFVSEGGRGVGVFGFRVSQSITHSLTHSLIRLSTTYGHSFTHILSVSLSVNSSKIEKSIFQSVCQSVCWIMSVCLSTARDLGQSALFITYVLMSRHFDSLFSHDF